MTHYLRLTSFSSNFFKCVIIVFFIVCDVYAAPPIGSPEDIIGCSPCCDADGNSIAAHPICGCDPVNSCGMCSSDESACDEPAPCQLLDCNNNAIPNSNQYCHLDLNRDRKVNAVDKELLTSAINSNQGLNPEIAHYDINKNGVLSASDVIQIVNFMNSADAGAVVDDCGVCGGGGENACGSCDPNIRDNGCGCGKPGPSGCDMQCGSTRTNCNETTDICESRFGLRIVEDEDWDMSKKFINEVRNLRPSVEGGCLNKQINDAMAYCDGQKVSKATKATFPGYAGINAYDDCVAFYFMGSRISLSIPLSTLPPEIVANAVHTVCQPLQCGCMLDKFSSTHSDPRFQAPDPVNGKCSTTLPYYGKGPDPIATFQTFPNEGFIFFDQACQAVPPPSDASKCLAANLYYNPSPISLVFDKSYDEEGSTIVRFPLDNKTCENCVFEWKASKNAPLLVFDPHKTGEITTAHQLFGNWAFGGKSEASLNESNRRPGAWRDGYEALESLDSNLDGKISGTELASLRLWFDQNKNGISEPGEVNDLSEHGVKELYYRSAIKNDITGDLVLDKGFLKVEGETEYVGKSVDWYGLGALTKEELILRKQLHEVDSKIDIKLLEKDSRHSASQVTKEDIRGHWEWKTGDGELSGLLMFSPTEDGRLFKGYALSETRLNGTAKFASVIGIRTLKGEALPVRGNDKYAFVVQTVKGEVESEFRVISKNTLKGVTKVKSIAGGKGLEYSWTATRKN